MRKGVFLDLLMIGVFFEGHIVLLFLARLQTLADFKEVFLHLIGCFVDSRFFLIVELAIRSNKLHIRDEFLFTCILVRVEFFLDG
jgi:hypothetical protein